MLAATGVARSDVAAVGLDTPGPASADGVISSRGATNFSAPEWWGYDVRKAAEDLFGVPVVYNNDGNAAALYAHRQHFGPAAMERSSVAAIVGTGFGGGVIESGQVVRGASGMAGELGHVPIPMEGLLEHDQFVPLCNCGGAGDVESVASLSGITNNLLPYWLARHADHPLHAVESIGAAARQVRAMAEHGDEMALQIFAQQAQAIGRLVHAGQQLHRPARVFRGWRCRGDGAPLPSVVHGAGPEAAQLRDEQRRVSTFAVVPDLDMAGARGSALAAFQALRFLRPPFGEAPRRRAASSGGESCNVLASGAIVLPRSRSGTDTLRPMAAPSRRVRTVWSDLNGLTHGRYIPSSRIDHPTHHAITTLVMGIDGEILPVAGYASDVGFPDLTATPLIDSRHPGWEPDTDVAICRLTDAERCTAGHLPSCRAGAGDRRVAGDRVRAASRLRARAVRAERDDSSACGWSPAAAPGHRVYGVGLGGDPTGMALAYFDVAERMGLRLEGRPLRVLTGADRGQHAVRSGARVGRPGRARQGDDPRDRRRAGFLATYLGRPHATSVGSGLHINMSLSPVNGGPNALEDTAAEHGLSTVARQAIGGLIHHHEAVAGLSAPLANSYKRLMPGLIAGYWANWGLDNRFATYRVPAERGSVDADREPHAVRHGEPVPGVGSDAQRRLARRRRRARLQRSADRRCR